MRKLMLLGLILSTAAFAQVTVGPGQVRNVVADTMVGETFGDVLFAAAIDPTTVDAWTILSQDNTGVPGVVVNEIYFDIDNQGQLSVAQSLSDFFPFALRAVRTVTIDVRAFGSDGSTDDETITINVIQGDLPFVFANQARQIAATIMPGDNVGDPLQATGMPTTWRIESGNVGGAFAVDNAGQITTQRFLDVIQFPVVNNGVAEVSLGVIASNGNGQSPISTVTVFVALVGNARCGDIPETQTRFVSSISAAGATIGDPIDTHGLDSIWIEEGWIDGQAPSPEVTTAFTILSPPGAGGSFGQLQTFGSLAGVFDPMVITKVFIRVKGHVFLSECPEFVEEDIVLYVLPADVGGGGGTPTGDPDFAAFINDATLLTCIRESLGGSQSISAQQVLDLIHLDCLCVAGNAITDVQGLRFFTNLQFLNLSNNLIEDIRPLAGLDQLTDLRLSDNLIIDITSANPLASLTGLQTLDLSNNQIVDAGGLATLSNIEFLSLADNQICDISDLVALAQLPDSGINTGDTVRLDGNNLNSSNGLQQIGVLQSSGAFVSFANQSACPPAPTFLTLPSWPERTVLDFTALLNTRDFPPCN